MSERFPMPSAVTVAGWRSGGAEAAGPALMMLRRG
jgi:hypothetical protein